MTDIADRAQLHRRRIRDALLAAEAAHPNSPELAALHTAVAQAEARLVDYFDLEDLEDDANRSGGGGKPPADPNDDGEIEPGEG